MSVRLFFEIFRLVKLKTAALNTRHMQYPNISSDMLGYRNLSVDGLHRGERSMSIKIALIQAKSLTINELLSSSHSPNFSVLTLSASIEENLLENVEKTLFHLINNTTCGLELFIIIYEESSIFKPLLKFCLSSYRG